MSGIILPDDWKRRKVIMPGVRPSPTLDNGLLMVQNRATGRTGAVLSPLGWVRLAVLLIRKHEQGTLTVTARDITDMPTYEIQQRFDDQMGLLDIVTISEEDKAAKAEEDTEPETETEDEQGD